MASGRSILHTVVAVMRSNSLPNLLATALCLGLALQFLACSHSYRTPTVRVIPKADWITALGPFANAAVRVNNFSPTRVPGQPPATAFHVANDSRIRLPDGTTVSFNIPVIRQDPYSIYINDMNSTAIGIDARSGRAIVNIAFEDELHEIVGNCVENVACVCGDPRINLDGAELQTMVRVGAAGGRLTVTNIASEFRSTFGETGPCRENVCAFLCDIIRPDRESQTRQAIQDAAVAFFNGNRGLIEALLNARLRDLGVTQTITSAIINRRGDLILTLVSV